MTYLGQIYRVADMELGDDGEHSQPCETGRGGTASADNSGDVPTPAIDELRSIKSWVCWKYVWREGQTKPTKPPVNPHNNHGASHSNPSHWGSHKQAKDATRRYNLVGEGFVLSDRDNFTGIDLDNCRDKETGEFEPWAEAVIALAETYAEISPSGRGVRLFARGKVASATKCDPAGVEIYGSHRYMTVTEDHVEGTPIDIRPAPKTLEMLLSRVEAMRPPREEAPAAAPHIDTTPRERASLGGGEFFKNVNTKALQLLGMWVTSLFPRAKYQNSTGAYRVSSKDLGRSLQEDLSFHPDGIKDHGVADMGDANQGRRTAIDIVLEYGGAPDAIAAAKWLCERLGKTPESLGWNEAVPHDEEISRIGNQIAEGLIAPAGVVEFDPEQDCDEADDAPSQPASTANRDELPDHLTHPPGVLGWIIDWIVASAQRPSRVLALGATICVLGTLIGRRVAGPTKSGTHLYVAMLAPSAAGKDHPIKRACDLVRIVNDRLVGPGEFSSQQGLLRWMADSPLSLCAFDEIGSFISRICNSRGGNWKKGLTKQFREFWGSSFEIVQGTHSAQFSTAPIKWPALSLLGVSTPGEFFDGLSSKEAANGFLNRFLLLSTARKPECVDEPTADKSEAPSMIEQTLTSLYQSCMGDAFLIEKEMKDTSLLNERKQIQIEWESVDVKAEYLALMRVIDKKIDNALIGELYGRTAEMAVRLATIHAVSRAGLTAKLTSEDFAWGRDLAMWSADTMASQASMRLADNETQARAKRVHRVIYEAGGEIKHRDLHRKLSHSIPMRDLRDIITSLKESGEIGERSYKNPKGGPAVVTYFMRRQ